MCAGELLLSKKAVCTGGANLACASEAPSPVVCIHVALNLGQSLPPLFHTVLDFC